MLFSQVSQALLFNDPVTAERIRSTNVIAEQFRLAKEVLGSSLDGFRVDFMFLL